MIASGIIQADWRRRNERLNRFAGEVKGAARMFDGRKPFPGINSEQTEMTAHKAVSDLGFLTMRNRKKQGCSRNLRTPLCNNIISGFLCTN